MKLLMKTFHISTEVKLANVTFPISRLPHSLIHANDSQESGNYLRERANASSKMLEGPS